MRKQLIALLLSILMVTALLPTAWAENGEAVTETTQSEIATRATGDVAIDSTNFPDANFLAFVDTLAHADPAYFTAAEIADITEIDCGYKNIATLQGIALFTSLERLNCQDNELDSIDVSMMPSLRVLDCHSNPLAGTVTFHENLEELECWNSQIEGSRVAIPANSSLRVVKVDASNFGDLSVLNGLALETLDCPYHDYGTLDFTAWPTLKDIHCSNCNLSSLTVTGLTNITRIRANDNNLTTLDLSGCTALTELYIENNRIPELRLPAGVALNQSESIDQRIEGQTATDNGDGTYSFDLSTLVHELGNVTVVSANASMDANGKVTFTSQPSELVYSYDIGDPNHPMQVTVELGVAVTVQPSAFDAGFFTWLLNNGIVTDNNGVYTTVSSVTELNCENAGLTSLKGIEMFQNLERLICNDNALTNDLSAELAQNKALKELSCHTITDLTALDLSANTALESLDLLNSYNLQSLNIANNTNLRYLNLESTTLPLKDENGAWIYANNTNLVGLCLAYREVTEIDVSMLTNLEELVVNGARITSLDLETIDSLKAFFAEGLQTAELILSENAPLEDGNLDIGTVKEQEIRWDDDGYCFDLSALVTKLDRVSNPKSDAGVTLDANGVLRFDAKPTWFSYDYAVIGENTVEIKFEDFRYAPEFRTKSLLLSGQIGVNFFMDLSTLTDDEKAESYMTFQINGRTVTSRFDGDFTDESGNGYYGFRCYIGTVEMADEITATFHYRDGKTVENKYTAETYLQKMPEDNPAKDLTDALQNYGHYIQEFVKTTDPATYGTHDSLPAASEMTSAMITEAKSEVSGCEIQRAYVEGSDIASIGFSLSVNDTVIINLYVRMENDAKLLSATANGENLEIEELDGAYPYRVRIPGIKASQLGDEYEVVLNAGGEDMTVKVSALSYVYAILTSSAYASDNAAKQAAAAIYWYYYEADKYLNPTAN